VIEIENMSGKPGNPAWVKGGPSPNPGGRPKASTALKQALEALAIDDDTATKKLKRLLESTDDKVALDAVKFLIDHVKGKPRQEITGEDGGAIKLDASSGLLETLKKLAGE
jgi:hypothetical protein